ncbi:MAG TPA: hypothetical protein VMX96_00145 [Dehalococcoidia bacterium]|nr:hypothetical protein [Dehalococcoidia bacterium]HUV56790.1 hypothetical protein [Dehalococcoidales bacterium]
MMKCWGKIKSFFKRPKAEAKPTEEKAGEPPETKAAESPEKKA